MIKITNGKIELTKVRKLTAKQLRRLNAIDNDKTRTQYALSLVGLSKSRINIDKPEVDHSVDKLADKSTGSVRSAFVRLLNNEDHIIHKPIVRLRDSFWVGVEIECLFDARQYDDDDSSCEYCGGSGEEQCYNCDGSGHVRLEDDNGNEYRVDCASCDGNGTRECSECDGSSGNGLHSQLREALRDARITNCSVKHDGSLSGSGKIGAEVTVLLDLRNGFGKLHEVCKVLNTMGASVNDTCGLHVHLDQFNFNRDEAQVNASKLGAFLPILGKLVPQSRRNNSYCRLDVSAINGDSRYFAVNATAYSKHKTIEVRLHSGTTNADKIEQWVKLLRAIVELKSVPSRRIGTIARLFGALKLTSEAVTYWTERFAKFNPSEESKTIAINDDEDGGEDEADFAEASA